MTLLQPFVFDFETGVIPDVGDYADDIPRPPARMKDPEKIQAWIDERRAKQALFAAVDIDLARIVCACWSVDGQHVKGGIAKDESEERKLLRAFWSASSGKTFVGFNVLDFDLPLAIRRSQLLDVPYPDIEIGRYRHPRVLDLMQVLTWDGKLIARKLDFYCRRFKVVCPADDVRGADVPLLLATQRWDVIQRHGAADVIKEWRLAERLGLVERPQAVADGTTTPF